MKILGFLLLMAAAAAFLLEPARPAPDDFEVNERKVLLVALEGADRSLLAQMAESGHTPRLAALAERAVEVTVTEGEGSSFVDPAMVPPKTWATVATGFPAQMHGVMYLPALRQGVIQELPVTSLSLRRLTVWDILSHYCKVAVVGWWTTWPAGWVNGYLVSDRFFVERFDLGPLSGAGHPDLGPLPDFYREPVPHLTWPEDLAGELTPVLEESRAGLRDPLLQRLRARQPKDAEDADGLRMLIAALEADAVRTQATLALLERDPEIRFTATYLGALDVACHLFWKYLHAETWQRDPALHIDLDPELIPAHRDVIAESCAFLDRQVGLLLDQVEEDTTVVLVSSHGFTSQLAASRRELDLNPLLERLGLLVRDESGAIDFRRTIAYDTELRSWDLLRQVRLNFEGDYDHGIVPGSSPELREREWSRVRQLLGAVRVDPPWQDHVTKEWKDGLFWHEGDVGSSGVQYGIYNAFPAVTEVQLPAGEVLDVETFFPRRSESGRHTDRGFVQVVFPGEEGRRAAGRDPPFGRELSFRTQIAPTILALLGLPLPVEDEEGALLPEALYWVFDSREAQRAALRKVSSYESALRGSGTPRAGREAELGEYLKELGYVTPPWIGPLEPVG